jgi:peroxiredoxin
MVVYAYPRTGQPGVDSPPGWDLIPGARGCTPQACSFRDHFAELKGLGVQHLFGLSTQSQAYQREAAERLHLPFAILSDEHLRLTHAMQFPTFEASGMTLLKRFTLIIDDGTVRHVFYPIFPPDRSAADVINWLSATRGNPIRQDLKV